MAKLGTLTLTGKSGQQYDFNVYSSGGSWKDNIACVYYISKRTKKSDGTGTHSAIYIGEAENLKERLADHHKQTCFDRHDYNAVSVHRESNTKTRLEIEQDLVDAIDPPCNG